MLLHLSNPLVTIRSPHKCLGVAHEIRIICFYCETRREGICQARVPLIILSVKKLLIIQPMSRIVICSGYGQYLLELKLWFHPYNLQSPTLPSSCRGHSLPALTSLNIQIGQLRALDYPHFLQIFSFVIHNMRILSLMVT